MVSVGVIVWLASELMFFAGLFGIYFTVRAQTDGEWPPAPTELDITYALVFTIDPDRCRRSPASSGCSPPSAATSSRCAAGTC